MSVKKTAEPKMTRTGLLAHPGSLIIGAVGIFFVAYVFNFQGLQTSLDGWLAGLDHSAKAHGTQVTTIFLFVLPVLATLLGGGILYILLSALGHALMGPVKEARKKKAKALARQAAEAKAVATSIKAPVAEPMVLVRPARLGRPDIGIAHIAVAKR